MASAPYAENPEELLSHADFVRGLARSLIRDEVRAEDVAQEAWLAALKRPARAEKLRAWLAGTVRNLALKTRRAERRFERRERGAAQPEAVRSAEELVVREAARRRVVEAVCALDEPYRSAVLFRYYDDLPPRAIATRLDIPVETVKTRIQRGLERMRRSLDAGHKGGRKAWCQALAPVAGLELVPMAAGGGASVLSGVLAMSLKIKIVLAAVLVAVLATTYFTLIDTDPGDRPGEERSATLAGGAGEGEEKPASPRDEVESVPGRTPLIPEDRLDTAMPESFRKAMGAFRGRVVEPDGTPVALIPVEMIGAHFLDFLRDVSTWMSDSPHDVTLKGGETLTADDGTFTLEGVYPRAKYALLVDAGGARPLTRVIDRLPAPGETVDLGDIVLQPHAVLLGRVADSEGNPVAGARVRATDLPSIVLLSGMQDYRKGCSLLVNGGKQFGMGVFDPPPAVDRLFPRLPVPTTTSRSDGSFRLEGVPLGSVTVLVDKERYATSHHGPVVLRESGERDLGEIELLQGMTVRGVAVDEKGNPVPGIEVRIGSVYLFKEAIVLQPPLFTDEKGAFALSGFAANTAMAVARRYPQDRWTTVDPFYPAGGSLVFTLPSGFDLTINAAAEDGSPVADVDFWLQNNDLPKDMCFLAAPAVPEGRMEFPEPGVVVVKDIPPGRYQYMVSAPGYATVRKSLTMKNESVNRDVVLKPALSVPVKVLDKKTGLPVEWAEVYACVEENDWLLAPHRVSRCRTDAAGRASMERLKAGEYRVTVSHPRYAVLSEQLNVPSDDEAVLLVERGGVLEGVVHRGSTDHAGPYMIILQMHWWSDNPEDDLPTYTVTDSEGRFRIDNLTPGVWFVEVGPRLFDKGLAGMVEAAFKMRSITHKEVQIKSGETSFLELNLEGEKVVASSSVSGRVLINGKPASGFDLTLNGPAFFSAKIDRNGSFDLDPIPAGEYGLELSWKTKGRVIEIDRTLVVEENAVLEENFDIMTGTLTGRVTANEQGDPMDKPCRLTVRTDDPGSPERVTISIETEPDGSFVVEGIPAGIYRIRSADHNLFCRPVSDLGIVAQKTTGPVIVVQSLYDLVSGRLVLSEDLEEAFLLLMVFLSPDDKDGSGIAVKVSKETGAFETRRLKPGAYSVFVSTRWKADYKPVFVEIPPGGITGLVITPEKVD